MQHIHSLAVEALAVLISRAHLVPADSGNESPDRCKKEVFVTGAHQSTECADEDQHEGNDKGLRAHGLGRLLLNNLGQRFELDRTDLIGVSKSELLDRGSRYASGVGEFKNAPAWKPLELGAKRLYGSDWLIHSWIIIHLRIGRQ